MTHLTLTGYYAGRVICGAARNESDQYLHAAYAPIEKLRDEQIAGFSKLCPDCLKMWDESTSE